MRGYGIQVIRWRDLDQAARHRALARPVAGTAGMQEVVADILQQVRDDGDSRLIELTQKYDGVQLDGFEVAAERLRQARASVDPELIEAIISASERIRLFHAADLPRDQTVETATGLTCSVRYQPLSVVGLYVPGGSAPLVSSVMMLAVPARLAGCRQVIMCTPPGADGAVSPELLAAASLCGVEHVYSLGGAQAVAAMAYGTETVPRCHKIFGPGNAWVTEAKQQVSRDPRGAAIDLPAGPSEVMVIADRSALQRGYSEFLAWDLLAQAEHGPDSQALLLTDELALADAVIAHLNTLGPQSARAAILDQSLRAARVILVESVDEALGIADHYAPEHLIINTANARQHAQSVAHAGSVFIGPWTPESLGDYCSGTNHVLPTYGWARSHGALGVGDFMRRMTLQEASAVGLRTVGATAETLARAEGLEAHRMAVRSRLTHLEGAP